MKHNSGGNHRSVRARVRSFVSETWSATPRRSRIVLFFMIVFIPASSVAAGNPWSTAAGMPVAVLAGGGTMTIVMARKRIASTPSRPLPADTGENDTEPDAQNGR